MILNITTTKPMENKQTAIEWMFDKLLEEGPSGELRWHLKYDIFKIFEQAKAMEKENMIELIRFMRTNDKMGKSLEDLYQEFQETYGK